MNGTKFFYKKPFEILDIAVNGFLNILKFSKERKIKNFYLASSSEVYQKKKKLSKLLKKCLKFLVLLLMLDNKKARKNNKPIFMVFARKYFQKFLIFRPHNVYGAKQNIWDMKISYLLLILEIIKNF